jgi:hypothetical protein
VNDVVLATAAGAIGRFLRQRGIPVEGEVFRAQVPMSIRTGSEHGTAGNRIVMLLAELPIDERAAHQRYSRVVQTTARLKDSSQRAGVEFFEALSNSTLTSLFLFFARIATWQRSYNIVVTNVPGPQFPVYLLGARMQEIYPLVPLAGNYWGFNADWDALPDIHGMVAGLHEEFESLHKAALKS